MLPNYRTVNLTQVQQILVTQNPPVTKWWAFLANTGTS